MSRYLEASKLFSDDLDMGSFMETNSIEHTKKKLFTTVKNGKIDTIFLVGNSGVGKTFLLKALEQKSKLIDVAKYYKDTNFTDEELLEALLERTNVLVAKGEHSKNALIENVKKHYKDLSSFVFVDNANKLKKSQLEFFRYLINLGVVRFIFAFSEKNFSDEGLNSKTINLGNITKDEIARYIEKQLLSKDLKNETKMFTKSEIDLIYKYSNANFKKMKQIVKTAFEIANIAHKKRLKDYAKIDKKTITMAAIDLGIIDVK
jgi:replication-associated recombination protein RarA